MNTNGWLRTFFVLVLMASCVAIGARRVCAIPRFQSFDGRLPNPDRPFEMVGGTVHYDSLPDFAIYDLEFSPSNPAKLDYPTRNPDGRLEFDSTFDINYKAVVSFSTQPPQSISGIGTARARGRTPADSGGGTSDWMSPNPQVFDTELVELNLFALSPIPEVMLRESPTLHSGGVTIRENVCPVCASPVTWWNVSSFFDIATEVTFNGGNTWTPARDVIHVEQAPNGFQPGDYNQDKAVDGRDYIVWRQTLGYLGAGLDADGDWSGQVDAADYDVWRQNFGGPAALGGSAIPEPASAVLMVLGMLSMRRMRIGAVKVRPRHLGQ